MWESSWKTKAVTIPIYAAGGIRNLEDIQKLDEIGVGGVIIGKALYNKKRADSRSRTMLNPSIFFKLKSIRKHF